METSPTPADQVTANADGVTHAGCRYCFTAPALGDSVTALCGDVRIFLGPIAESDPRPLCPMCAYADTAVVEHGGCDQCLGR